MLGRGQINEALYTSNGDWLVFQAGSTSDFSSPDIFALELGVDSVGRPLLAEDYAEWSPALSPNGLWLAYTSDESGQPEVYVRPFPDVDSGKWPISIDGGRNPKWAHSGRELLFQSLDGEFVAVEVTSTPTFTHGEQEVLFGLDGYLPTDGGHPVYDVSSDDQRFVMLRAAATPDVGRLILVENFFDEIRQLIEN